jgi:hypothetical protein
MQGRAKNRKGKAIPGHELLGHGKASTCHAKAQHRYALLSNGMEARGAASQRLATELHGSAEYSIAKAEQGENGTAMAGKGEAWQSNAKAWQRKSLNSTATAWQGNALTESQGHS